jgi:hypothetical protein
VAFTAEQKREHRAKPEVQAKQRAYKRSWDQENKQRRTEYMRQWRRGCQLAVRHHHHHHRGRAIYSMATLPEMPVGPSYQLQPERGRAARLIKIYDEKILWGWS